ncbi:hypothetical protein AB3X52_14395 [Nocardioides sp. DS6]|uniref:Uncharacterized protein n=1 Tax=Nocardioides eburneus TaxID=3231482 RepID=A0ABV3T0T2_9ACTN
MTTNGTKLGPLRRIKPIRPEGEHHMMSSQKRHPAMTILKGLGSVIIFLLVVVLGRVVIGGKLAGHLRWGTTTVVILSLIVAVPFVIIVIMFFAYRNVEPVRGSQRNGDPLGKHVDHSAGNGS